MSNLLQERLKDYITEIPELSLFGVFYIEADVLSFLQKNNATLVFLDIHMDGISCISMLKSYQVDSQVILKLHMMH